MSRRVLRYLPATPIQLNPSQGYTDKARQVSRNKQNLILIATTLAVVSLSFLGSTHRGVAQLGLPDTSMQIAQQLQLPSAIVRDVWKQVYQQLPNLPLENKYVSQETGKVNPNSTLVDRLIRYHVYTKGRSPNYRLDWKLTLADYLRANEVIQEAGYPGADTLRQNPLEGDLAAISRLNRKQRDALVQTLVSVFNPNRAVSPTENETSVPPQPSPTPQQETPSFNRPKPGDARLLEP